jgi:hypothetical protein
MGRACGARAARRTLPLGCMGQRSRRAACPSRRVHAAAPSGGARLSVGMGKEKPEGGRRCTQATHQRRLAAALPASTAGAAAACSQHGVQRPVGCARAVPGRRAGVSEAAAAARRGDMRWRRRRGGRGGGTRPQAPVPTSGLRARAHTFRAPRRCGRLGTELWRAAGLGAGRGCWWCERHCGRAVRPRQEGIVRPRGKLRQPLPRRVHRLVVRVRPAARVQALGAGACQVPPRADTRVRRAAARELPATPASAPGAAGLRPRPRRRAAAAAARRAARGARPLTCDTPLRRAAPRNALRRPAWPG